MAGRRQVALAAGGTAGHIEPALNLADALRRLDPDVGITVIGGTRGLESSLVPARGYDLRQVASVPMPRRPSMDLLLVGPRLRKATRSAEQVLSDVDADIVVGFGGYAALPTYRAARRLGIPLVVHEANAKPGLANRLAARWTSHVFTAFPGTLAKAEVVGLPLRSSISGLDRNARRTEARAHFGLAVDAPTLLVFGGSQGATHVNAVLAASLDALLDAGIQVLHACGPRNEPPPSRPGYVPAPYIDRMDLAYAAADLAIVRAGAMTCAELAAIGLPAVYVPLPIGNGEQRLNALPVVEAGGGLIVDNDAFTAGWLTTTVLPLMHDGDRLRDMGAAASACGVRDADERLARIVVDVMERSRRP